MVQSTSLRHPLGHPALPQALSFLGPAGLGDTRLWQAPYCIGHPVARPVGQVGLDDLAIRACREGWASPPQDSCLRASWEPMALAVGYGEAGRGHVCASLRSGSQGRGLLGAHRSQSLHQLPEHRGRLTRSWQCTGIACSPGPQPPLVGLCALLSQLGQPWHHL